MPTHFLFKLFSSALVVTSVLLTGCNDAPGTGATEKSAKTASGPVSMAALAAQAIGFTAGSQMSARTVYVFFDAQCPHCGVLWEAAKPLRAQAKFVWIPVGILNASSTSQGATILAAADPVAEMDKHEASLQAGQGGISAAANIDANKASIAKNTELMTSFGFASIPVIIGTNAQTGALVTQEGAMPTAALAKLLGLQAPAN
ncbi:thioredoxin fold domain-containing protein [Polaromonas hydrogenivorans]|uniref:Thioredoxin fold domain-containing protein n=1 Tax=Polaromonas hydrogenivorans TaxID=335476 RepID=A0AAU7LLI6_9BURK